MSADAPVRHRTDAANPEWERLNARLILVHASLLAAPLASWAATLVATGGKVNLQALITLGSLLITFLVVTSIGMMRYLTTRYRITEDRVELRSGLLFRSHRAIRLDRIRSVDLTANPVHRVFGLTSLRIGTGEQTHSAGRKLTLDGVSKAQAAELRQRLLSRRDALGAAAVEDDGLIADMDWSWIRYAPLTIWGVGGVLAAVGTAYRTLHEMKVDPLQLGFVKDIEAHYGSVPLWFGILITLLIIVVLGAIFSTATFTEGWYGYRLEREDGGTFRVLRGLLVTRSVTIEERRLRGVELGETMFLRWAGGARLNAVASGLGDRDENRKRRMLTPPVPRAEALRVAADVLSEAESPTSLTDLRPHPRIALRRRVNRALTVTALIVIPLAALGLWLSTALLYAAVAAAVVLLPVTLALAYDAYRTLGHGMRGRYLVTRSGTFAHRTVALQREGIIGWNISSSFFQRRSGLLTLGATTSAGEHCYKVRDVTVSEGLSFAEEAVPHLLTPFLERVPTHRRDRRRR
ncbi:PH domain-containing protein [Streptantibioticus rubrisoli]|uniref:PH domain-containing protein n=1 Tax=Streptantibioticus rubrisoli TaxID=1387313 RepID=A0ABT1PGQ9_9ACTN|nr:PH domain-containing protein [Streptantibioticus rubrisoli]MCQ4044557.1 PH domain-containing protein [Streptantibioticus rubrisoli]